MLFLWRYKCCLQMSSASQHPHNCSSAHQLHCPFHTCRRQPGHALPSHIPPWPTELLKGAEIETTLWEHLVASLADTRVELHVELYLPRFTSQPLLSSSLPKHKSINKIVNVHAVCILNRVLLNYSFISPLPPHLLQAYSQPGYVSQSFK